MHIITNLPAQGANWAKSTLSDIAQKTTNMTKNVAYKALNHLVAIGAQALYGTISIVNKITGKTKVEELAFIINKLTPLVIPLLGLQTYGPHQAWIQDCLNNTLAPTLTTLISDETIDHLFQSVTQSIKTNGLSNQKAHLEAVLSSGKILYTNYLNQ